MRPLLSILLLITAISAGTPAEDWRSMSQAQRDFAFKCIAWGRAHKDEFYYTINGDTLDLGETLAGLGWNESSLGVDNEHGEDYSSGPFGIRPRTICGIAGIFIDKPNSRGESCYDNVASLLERDFDFAAASCLLIYADNIRYIKQWHRNRGLTITDREAWRKASQVYRDGTNWRNRANYGHTFRQRVAFLRTVTRSE